MTTLTWTLILILRFAMTTGFSRKLLALNSKVLSNAKCKAAACSNEERGPVMRDNCVNISDVSSLTPSFCSVSTFNTLFLSDAAHDVVAHSDAALCLSGPGARVLQWQVSGLQPHEELGLGECFVRIKTRPVSIGASLKS